MGDSFQTLVVKDVDLEEASVVGERVRAILIERGIIRPERSKECVLSGEGHSLGAKWKRAVRPFEGVSPDELVTHGVVVEVGRQLHGFGGMNLRCPACRAEQAVGPQWNAAERAYVDRGEVLVVPCFVCGVGSPSVDWTFDWPMTLGALAITFWNWPPLKRSFIEDLAGDIIDRPIELVRGTI